MSLVEEILAPYGDRSGVDGYKNHVYRVIDFCAALSPLDDKQRKKVAIAACFHDLGLFTEDTFDYLSPSISLARAYLTEQGLNAWQDEITTMIDNHHCLRKTNGTLTEIFRKADLIDFSLGFIKCGLSRSEVGAVKARHSNAGFHKHLARTAGRWICRHPLNPVPVLKW